jgi:hypothetical protein
MHVMLNVETKDLGNVFGFDSRGLKVILEVVEVILICLDDST